MLPDHINDELVVPESESTTRRYWWGAGLLGFLGLAGAWYACTRWVYTPGVGLTDTDDLSQTIRNSYQAATNLLGQANVDKLRAKDILPWVEKYGTPRLPYIVGLHAGSDMAYDSAFVYANRLLEADVVATAVHHGFKFYKTNRTDDLMSGDTKP